MAAGRDPSRGGQWGTSVGLRGEPCRGDAGARPPPLSMVPQHKRLNPLQSPRAMALKAGKGNGPRAGESPECLCDLGCAVYFSSSLSLSQGSHAPPSAFPIAAVESRRAKPQHRGEKPRSCQCCPSSAEPPTPRPPWQGHRQPLCPGTSFIPPSSIRAGSHPQGLSPIPSLPLPHRAPPSLQCLAVCLLPLDNSPSPPSDSLTVLIEIFPSPSGIFFCTLSSRGPWAPLAPRRCQLPP